MLYMIKDFVTVDCVKNHQNQVILYNKGEIKDLIKDRGTVPFIRIKIIGQVPTTPQRNSQHRTRLLREVMRWVSLTKR